MKIPVIEQHDSSDCATAYVASMCAFYGREMTSVKLRELLGTDMYVATVKGVADPSSNSVSTQKQYVQRAAFLTEFTLPAVAHFGRIWRLPLYSNL